MSNRKVKTADETKVDDMLIEMITPKVREIEEKFSKVMMQIPLIRVMMQVPDKGDFRGLPGRHQYFIA